jgi:2-dehydropantoate 2-reductase
MLEKQTIAIIGPGAVGGYYGARLAQAGQAVHFLLRGDYQAVRANGWIVKSCDGDFTLPADRVHAHRTAREMPKADLVLVTLKTTANDQFETLIPPLLTEDSVVLTLQNGLGNEDRLAALFSPTRVMGGLAFTCINRIGPGVIHHLAEGQIRIGEFAQAGPSPRGRRISELFNAAGIRCDVLDDLRQGRWHKLSWNVAFNGLGAAMDLTTDQVVGTPEGVALATTLLREIIAIGGAVGVAFPEDWVDRQIDKTRAMGAYQTSMQVDRRHRRPMEVEAILGAPLRVGRAHGISAPMLEVVDGMVRAVDAEIQARSI